MFTLFFTIAVLAVKRRVPHRDFNFLLKYDYDQIVDFIEDNYNFETPVGSNEILEENWFGPGGYYDEEMESVQRKKRRKPKRFQEKKVGSICDCVDEWEFIGKTFHGCDPRHPKDDRPWCYIDSPTCPRARRSTVVPGKYWRYCEAEGVKKKRKVKPAPEHVGGSHCQCEERWRYKGGMFDGCDQKAPKDNHPWCYVQGGEQCSHAKESKQRYGKFWRYCRPEGLDNVPDVPYHEPSKPHLVVHIFHDPETAEERGQYISEECKCMDTWDWKHTEHHGCDERSPDFHTHWCYVAGKDCWDAKPSRVHPGLAWKTCTPGEDTWSSEKLHHTKCDDCHPCHHDDCGEKRDFEMPRDVPKPQHEPEEPREPEENEPMEHIPKPEGKTCKCKSAWTFKNHMYLGCDSRKPESEDPWCYVHGGAECDGVKESSVTPGKFWRGCSTSGKPPPIEADNRNRPSTEKGMTCDCKADWTFRGEKYHGCDPRQPDNPEPWCYVNGDKECEGVKESTVTPGAYWRDCVVGKKTPSTKHKAPTCMCETVWEYDGVSYEGCDERKPGNPSTWCYIDGDGSCDQAKESSVTPGRYWKDCECTQEPGGCKNSNVPAETDNEACGCEDEWEWNGAEYSGCMLDPPSGKRPWCYIKGDDSTCPGAEKPGLTKGRFWKHCGGTMPENTHEKCRCKKEWMYEDKLYVGCDTRKPDNEEPWCYIEGDHDLCPESEESETNPGVYWKVCSAGGMENLKPSEEECSCKAIWMFKDEEYNACDERKPDNDKPWCYIYGDESCPGAKESEVVKGEFWKDCGSESEPENLPDVEPSKGGNARPTCLCKDSWTYGGEEYSKCDERSPDHEEPWCYLDGDMTCPMAKESKVQPGEVWAHCNTGSGTVHIPGECHCKEEWEFKGEIYTACDPKMPEAEAPWCYTLGGDTCPTAKESEEHKGEFWIHCTAFGGVRTCSCKEEWEFKGKKYGGCDDSSPESDTPWCYIDGDADCNGAQESEIDPLKYWMECGEKNSKAPKVIKDCDCMETWTYDDVTYQYCDSRKPDAEEPWCYIHGDGSCPDAEESEVTPGMFWKKCPPGVPGPVSEDCDCMAEWDWDGAVYRYCDARAPEADAPWCYIHGDGSCAGAKESTVTPGLFYKEECGPPGAEAPKGPGKGECGCKPDWDWDGETYHDCDPRKPDADKPWCYISGSTDCDGAAESEVTPGLFYKDCTATSAPKGVPAVTESEDCGCKAEWEWAGATYDLCDPRKPDAEKPWCYIKGDAECPGAAESEVKPGTFYKDCTPTGQDLMECKCKPDWKWQEETYHFCDARAPDAEKPWCYVEGGAECAGAAESEVTAGLFYKDCGESKKITQDDLQECSCKGMWMWEETEYFGCDKRKPDADKPWCYIQGGGTECDGAEESTVTPGAFYKDCTPTPASQSDMGCECKSEWEWDDEIYHACDGRAPEADEPWCYINGDKECPGAKESEKTPGSFWKECTAKDGEEKKDDSSNADCNCMADWEYEEEMYHGCDPRKPEADEPWCYIAGGLECAKAEESEITAGRFFKYCGAGAPAAPAGDATQDCACKDAWTWRDETYHSCDARMPDAEAAWCYVQGGAKCKKAEESSVTPGEFYRDCGKPQECGCRASWEWDGGEFHGCDERAPDAEEPWCYVDGDHETCPLAKESEKTPGLFWLTCGEKAKEPVPANCECNDEWVFDDEHYFACDKRQPESDKPWCYTGASCALSKESTIKPGAHWRYCVPEGAQNFDEIAAACKCKPEWTWEDKVYSGCDPSHPGEEKPWCYVADQSCNKAKVSQIDPTESWRYCGSAAGEETTGAPAGACPNSDVQPSLEQLDTLDLQCSKLGALQVFCAAVEKLIQNLASEGKVKMEALTEISPKLWHSSCKVKGAATQWWEGDDNRPQKKPRNACLQASSCVATTGVRGPKYITKPELCNGQGVQFEYTVEPNSGKDTKVFQFMDRHDFQALGQVFRAHKDELGAAFTPELIDEHMNQSFEEGKDISGETVKFVLDMFKIPGYYATEANEVCLENSVLKTVLESGKKVYEDDHVVEEASEFAP